jgi:hypothetical protein
MSVKHESGYQKLHNQSDVKKIIFSFLLLTGALFSRSQDRDPLFHDAGIYTSLERSAGEPTTVVPQVWIYFKNYYLEARFNYEDLRTFSLYFGKSFYAGKRSTFEITPMIGAVAGNLNGISPGLNVALDHLRFSTYTQTQYTFDLRNSDNSFYWDWTNFSYAVYKNFGIGGSVQVYLPRMGDVSVATGPLVNFKFKHLLLEAFSYDFWKDHPVWALGIQYTLD